MKGIAPYGSGDGCG